MTATTPSFTRRRSSAAESRRRNVLGPRLRWMRHVGCDVCGSDDPELFAERPPRWDVLHRRFVRCRACGLVYADPRAEPHEARAHYERVDSRGSGSLDASTSSDTWRKAVAARREHLDRAAAIVGDSGRQARFLELGFGDASALAAALELGWEPWGLEYAGWLVEAARERLGLDHVAVGDVADLAAEQPGAFDVVYAWHVVEHVLDVDAWLVEIRRLLRPGGALMLGTENMHGLYGRLWTMPARLVRRTPWPPTSTDHTYWFGHEHLERLLRRHGLAPASVRVYENPPAALFNATTIKAMRNPRWALAFGLYLCTAVASVPAPRLGGKLEALALAVENP